MPSGKIQDKRKYQKYKKYQGYHEYHENNTSKTLILLKHHFLPLITIIFVTVWSLWVIVKSPGNTLVNAGDDILITWIINQNIQKTPNDIGNFFQGNIFYPYKNTLAFSEIFLPSAIIAYFPVRLTNLPVVAYGFNLLVGQILTMTVLYLWLEEMTKDRFASLLAVVALALSQIRFHYVAHLQMWQMQWWLLASWMIWKYTKNFKTRYVVLAGVLTVIQAWESLLPVFFICLISIILLSPYLKQIYRNSKIFLVISIFIIIFILPVLNAYFSVWRQFHIQRTIRDSAHFALSPDELWGRFFSPGLFGLFLVSILTLNKRVLEKSWDLIWLFGVLIFGLIMSLGPVLKWNGQTVKLFNDIFIPLPYGIAYYLIPGFGALRTPSRWVWLSAFGAAGLIALALSKYKSKYRNFVLITGFILAIFGGTRLSQYHKTPIPVEYPSVYHWLRDRSEIVIIELPIYTWGVKGAGNEFWRMLYSLEHKKKLVNGASGFSPPPWETLVGEITRDFPNPSLEFRLREIGVELVIVHKDEYDSGRLEGIKAWGVDKLVSEDADVLVYKL